MCESVCRCVCVGGGALLHLKASVTFLSQCHSRGDKERRGGKEIRKGEEERREGEEECFSVCFT